jgi:uncharacterized integral membrane protein
MRLLEWRREIPVGVAILSGDMVLLLEVLTVMNRAPVTVPKFVAEAG